LQTGRLVPGSKLVIATVGVGIFVRRGAAMPDVATADAFLRSLAAAKAIAYSDPALGSTAANHVGRLMDSLDPTGAIRRRPG
jgi:molybdate transport system substrate-binding protein